MVILRNLCGALSSYQRHLNEVLQMIATSDSVPLLAEYSHDCSGYVRQLLSEPVMSAFGQLLSLQELMLLRHDLLR